MKALKAILLLLGLIAAATGGVMLFMAMNVELKVIWEIATRYSTVSGAGTDLRDPRPNLLIITGIAVGAGLLLGLGLGLPARLGLSEKKLEESIEARVQSRLNAVGGPSDPVPPTES
jgi:hypothetical protein